jgi:hypothetical protein
MSFKWRKYQGVKCYKCGNEAPNCCCPALNRTWAGYPMQLQEQWYGQYTPAPRYFNREVRRAAISFYRGGFRQRSRRYCLIGIGLGPMVEVSEAVLNCMRRIDRLVGHYEFTIPFRIEAKLKEQKRQARQQRIRNMAGFVYGLWDQVTDQVLSKMTFDRELTKEEKQPLGKWARETFGKSVTIIQVREKE